MEIQKFSLDKPQTFFINNTNHLDLGLTAAMGFFSFCSNWFLKANQEQRKIRIVVDHDPISGRTEANFSTIE